MVDNSIALNVKPIEFAQNFQQGYNNGIDQQRARQQQEAAELQKWAQVGLGVMGGKLDGEIDPNALGQFLEVAGNDPIAQRIKANPELLRSITKGSLDVLRYAQDAEQFEFAKKKFEAELAKAQQGETTTDITEYNFAVKNGYKGSFEEWKKNGGSSDETFAMQPTYYKVTDPTTGKVAVKFGQMGSRGTFKETALPEGAEPAIPVTQLNTETGFVPVDKFGGRPEEAVTTPINNQQAAYDTAVGKGEGEKTVEMPEKRAKAGAALNALERQQGLVGEDIDKAIETAEKSGLFTNGFLGDLTKAVSGTPAYDLAQTLLTIQSNIGFDQLQEMRNNSPTGGALGAISDKETALLQAVNGATAQGQSPGQFKQNLQRIKDLMAEVLAERKSAFARDFGGGASATPPAPSAGGANPPAVEDDVIDAEDYF